MKNILLASHYTSTPGAMDKMALYLKKHNYVLFYILNPLNPKSSLKSVIKTKKRNITYKIPWPLQYILEGIVFLLQYKLNKINIIKFDLAICFDPLSFVHTLIIKRLLKIRKIIYFNVDFSTKRFRNRIANSIYLSVNTYAYRTCDYFFSISKSFTEKIDPNKIYIKKSFFLTHTINLSSRKKLHKKQNAIIYAGSISYTVDFTKLIKSLELLRNDNIDFCLDIYGDGQQKKRLQGLIRSSNISKFVTFKGVVPNDVLVKDILPRYIIGISPYINKKRYVETDHMFTGTDLTTKIVEYIGCGLPVITTRVYDAFDMIEKDKFGFLVKSTNEWYRAIKTLLLDKKIRTEYSANALRVASRYNEDLVLSPIFGKILN